MRTVPVAWSTLETSRERQVALLFHIWIRRDAYNNGATAGRVTPPVGWGSWTYSTGFQGNVNFTDQANYAQDWQLANGGNPITRTYTPAAIGCDLSQVFRKEDTSLDPHSIKLTVDPALEPFADYVNRSWPLVFGITISRVYRNGNAVATVDNGFGTQIPVVDVLFVGYLSADDTLELNDAGLQLEISAPQARAGSKATLTTEWDSLFKPFDREVPPPIESTNCPKLVFSTGNGAAVDCNADMPHVQVTGTVVQMNGIIISAVEWGASAAAYMTATGLLTSPFIQGLVQYTETDPVSGLDFAFQLQVNMAAQRVSDGVTYGDLYLGMFPPLMSTGTVVQAFFGCDRTRVTCKRDHIPAGTQPAPVGTFTPGTLRVSLELIAQGGTGNNPQNPTTAHVYFCGAATTLNIGGTAVAVPAQSMWIVYGRDNVNQIGNIFVGPGTAIPWDPTWASNGSSIVTDPVFSLTGNALVGPPAQDGYRLTISSDAGTNPSITQQPNGNNDYVTVVKCSGGAPGDFDFTIAWVANVGTPTQIGNLPNFGGTDTPFEHPSLETTQ